MRKNYRILVLGGNGYLGNNIVNYLTKKEYQTAAVVRSTYKVYSKNKSPLIYQYSTYSELFQIFSTYQPNIVINTVCKYSNVESKDDQVYEANVIFGRNIISIINALNLAVTFINFDTALPSSINLYSKTKHIFRSELRLINSKNVRVINLICQMFYGPNDTSTRLIPSLIKRMLMNENPIDLTYGKQKRDIIYIDDLLCALEKIIQHCFYKKHYSEIEVGSGFSIAIYDLANAIRNLTGYGHKLNFGAIPIRENEPNECVANTDHLMRLGWRQTVMLNDGLLKIINLERQKLIKK